MRGFGKLDFDPLGLGQAVHTVSWFQLVPNSPRKNQECEEKLAENLLAAHIQLQNEGRLSAWTYSSHAKGQKLKLWLFLPGRQGDSNGKPSLDLKVWICPGTSTEVTAALCQALRNRFEKALNAFAYVRFGDMFVKCKRYAADDSDFRRTLPSCEATFFASEEGVFAHLCISKRCVSMDHRVPRDYILDRHLVEQGLRRYQMPMLA